jgi:hypothetical protein
VRPRKIDSDFLGLQSTHALGIFNRPLDGVDGRFGINDYTFTQSASFRFTNSDHVEQTTLAWLASNTRHLARPDVETDCVLRALGHLAVLLR